MQNSCFSNLVIRKKIISASTMKECNVVSEEESEEETDGVQESNNQSSSTKTVDVTATAPARKKRKAPTEVEVSESQLDDIKSLILNRLPKSALSKHMLLLNHSILLINK